MPPRRPAKSRSRLLVISLSVAVGLAIAGVVGWFGLQWWRARETARIRTEAFADFDAGNFEEALLPLSRVVSRDADKKDAEAIRRLAKARLMVPELNNAHIPQAATFFNAAIAADPNDIESHRELLKLQFGMRRLVEAERTAQDLLRLDPSDSTATQLLARMLIIKDDRDGAERLLAKRVKEHPKDIDAKVQLWQLWMQAKKSPEECLVEIDGWLAEPDADPALRVMRAERLRAAGRGPEARTEMDAIVHLQPRSVSSCRLVARTLARIGRMDAARRVLAEGARSIGGPDGSQVASELFQMGWLADDLDMAAEGVAIAAPDRTARWTGRAGLTVAFLRDDAKALDEAIAAFKPSGAKAAADLDFAHALPLVLAGLKDPAAMPKANAAVERALVSNPGDPVLLYAHYELRLAAGDRGSAIAAGAEAFEASGNAWVRVGVTLVPTIEAYGDRARAKAILDRLAETQSSHPKVQMLLVLASADAVGRGEAPVIPEQEYANLARSLEKQAATSPTLAPVAVLSLATSGQQARARILVDRILGDPASSGELLLEVARITRQSKLDQGTDGTALIDRLLAAAAQRGVPPLQIEAFRAMGGNNAESLPALLALADQGNVAALRTAAALADLRYPEQAAAILERILKDDPSAEGLAIVLNSQTAMGRPDLLEAAVAASERLEGGRGDSTAIPRARLLVAKGNPSRADLDAALAELDDIRQRRGENTELLSAMATLLLASDPPDITAAARLAGKAATLAPDRGQLQLLAAALFRQSGNNDSATLYLQKAVASPGAKSDPAIRRGIVDEMRSLGQSKPAAAEARSLAESTGLSGDWIVAANLSEVADEPTEVERCLRAAIAAPDAAPIAWSRLASGLGRAGRIDDGRAVLKDLRERYAETAWLPIEVEFELAFGPRDAAVARLDEAYAKYPDDPMLMLLKARERINARDAAAALAIAQRAAKADATRMVARDIALMIAGEPDPVGGEAIEALATAGGLAAEPLRELRKMRDGAQNPSATRALELARKIPQLWVLWAFALDVAQAAKDPTNRLVIGEEAVRALPNDPRALAAYSSILLDYGRPGEARDVAERLRILAKTAPEYRAPAVRFAALGQLGTGQAGRAKEMLVAFTRESQDLDAIMLAAAIDAQLGNIDAAYARAKPVVATSDPALIYWMRLVGSLGPKEAKAALLAAAEHESRMPNLFASAWILASGRDDPAGLDRAARLIESARAAGRPALETAAVAFELAVARNDAARIEQARTALAAELNEAARELLGGKLPSTPLTDASGLAAADAITTEAKALLDRGRDLERAQRLLEAAVAAQGTADQRVALARALAARSQADAAAETALRLTHEFPANPDAWVALARARLAERDREGALTAVEEGRKAVTSTFFVAPKVKAELEAMAGAISAMSTRN